MAGDQLMECSEMQGRHDFQIQDTTRRIADLEGRVTVLERYQSAAIEQTKTLFRVLEELKSILRESQQHMESAMQALGESIDKRLQKVETDLDDLKGRDGKKWELVVTAAITAFISVIVTVAVTSALSGKVAP